jgi:co-chaperonin GroES (HSP10)
MTLQSEPTSRTLDLEHVISNGYLYGPHLLIRILPPEKVTSGGIVIPESHEKRRRIAKVIKIGTGVQALDGHVDFEIDDLVWFTIHSAQNIPELGEDIFHIHARDVIIRLPKEHSDV